jgi:hypothetical protein
MSPADARQDLIAALAARSSSRRDPAEVYLALLDDLLVESPSTLLLSPLSDPQDHCTD